MAAVIAKQDPQGQWPPTVFGQAPLPVKILLQVKYNVLLKFLYFVPALQWLIFIILVVHTLHLKTTYFRVILCRNILYSRSEKILAVCFWKRYLIDFRNLFNGFKI